MTKPAETAVLVVGGGPVGLTLAMDLAWRGIPVIVAELRRRGEAPSVKCNHVSARSMEIFRRLGVAQKLRNAGLPADYPNDCSYRTTTTGIELARIPIPCRRDRYTARDGPDTWWPTPEPAHRINQIFLEPVLGEHASGMPGLQILHRTSIDDFSQGEDGVVAMARNLDTGEIARVACRYMVGCDGGRSEVRRKIGATLSGTPVVQRVQSTYIRAPGLLAMLPGKPAWVMFSLNSRRSGNVMAIDGRETWLVHNYLNDGEEGFESVDRDWAIRTILGVGADFPRAKDLHVHLPAGATPKDGPSAGVALVTAIVSALTGRAVRGDVAMTGEITLRGRVLPVGGVKEKAVAAHRARFTHLVLPKQNVRDLEELPEEVRSGLTVHAVETVDEVLAIALLPHAGDVAAEPTRRKASKGESPPAPSPMAH